MDAPEIEQDVRLQRTSAESLADLQQSLVPFLWKKTKSGRTQTRRRVKVKETERLVNLLEPFQELPQLLDPHLDKLVPVLANAFLAFLQSPPSTHPSPDTQLLIPLPRAICRLLYTFCKIRGEKVIVRFFSTETRHLELLLSAIEAGSPDHDEQPHHNSWDWEERYITLLWVSQLLLAPFDLASISSQSAEDTIQPDIPGFVWPSNVPGITYRVISIGVRYISSSGKERDAARILLVRIAMRRDMQDIGMLQSLVDWALSRLHPSSNEHSMYYYIGTLSFLAGILNSSVSTSDMDHYLTSIFRITQEIAAAENATFKAIYSSAVARKTIIKTLRTIVLILLPRPNDNLSEILQNTIGHMLECLTDPATPVRLAASKSLSIITMKLPSEMALDVVEEVLDTLKKNVLWVDKSKVPRSFGDKSMKPRVKTRDISRVDPLEWHGLIMTLSHLLYRGSIPARNLSPVLDALRIGLSFEQRSTSGSSIGTNVRDAACFGIWALARRYSTAELQALTVTADLFTRGSESVESLSALQTIATDLIVSASLDPAGNIRRGSSAALQELIGRHSDTIVEGIKVVQVVDYHAVALRSRAVEEVAFQAAELYDGYYKALLHALLGWRGVEDGDATARRNAALAVGNLVWANGKGGDRWNGIRNTLEMIGTRIKSLEAREVNERHGLILSLASVIGTFERDCGLQRVMKEYFEYLWKKSTAAERSRPALGLNHVHQLYIAMNEILLRVLGDVRIHFDKFRHPELIAEASCQLIVAADFLIEIGPILATNPCDREQNSEFDRFLPPLRHLINNQIPVRGADGCDFLKAMQLNFANTLAENHSIMDIEKDLLQKFTRFDDKYTVEHIANASLVMFLQDHRNQTSLLENWIAASAKGDHTGRGKVCLHILFKVFQAMDGSMQASVIETVLKRWELDRSIETRAVVMRCLGSSSLIRTHMIEFVPLVADALDDYTTNARGDVGSLVRIEAAKAVGVYWDVMNDMDPNSAVNVKLFGGVVRTAAEKLDRVRVEGQRAISMFRDETLHLANFTLSSKEYFSFLLKMQLFEWWGSKNDSRLSWNLALFEGLVTSADTGSEDLVRASRTAIVEFCDAGNVESVCKFVLAVLEHNLSNDRVLVPALEVIGFLFDMQIMQESHISSTSIFHMLDQPYFRTSNVRKLEACVKIYGGMGAYQPAVKKLGTMMLHRFPKIRNLAAEEMFVATGLGKGIDWVKAGRADLKTITDGLVISRK